ncbi:Arylsulfatase [Aquirufa nivalisilvae]|uniref:Arylsulfatase n=1 Tax=Aquirufa nivalisilvae TaxID=2516557 RepID=A0A2S2DTJ3_9BACT|nr:sulfatase [Aquirufa nivalisilvae]AWL08695.1 Arylsulfatase [Aquirufa nivalisilvae]
MKKIVPILWFVLVAFNLIAQNTSKPNIITFIVDDMGWTDAFNPNYHTPNMAKLAKQGVKFSQAYATPVCTPTRTSFLSGMNAAHHGVTNWTSPVKDKNSDADDQQFSPSPWKINGLSPNEYTSYPQLLKQAGYLTIHDGKAHWGVAGTPQANPYNVGFQVNISGHAAGHPQSYYGKDNYGNLPGKVSLQAVPDLEEYHGSSVFLTEALTLEALKTLDTPIQNKQPFYLNLAHYGVHTPIQSDDRFFQKYLAAGLDSAEAKYASLVEGVDKSLGDIMNYLDEKKVAGNTIILFMSDNGGLSLAPARGKKAHVQNLPLRAGKGSVYEGGIRIPVMVKWPGVAKVNQVANQYVMAEDLFPTILEMAKLSRVKTLQTLDGQSMVPYLKNPSLKNENRILVWHYPNKWIEQDGPGINYKSAIRRGDYKLVYDLRTGQKELYNLSQDMAEQFDLASKLPEQCLQLTQLLKSYMMKHHAPMPVDKKTGKVVEIH